MTENDRPASRRHGLLLVSRPGTLIHRLHVDALLALGADVHLLTEVRADASDPRFASVTVLEPGLALEAATNIAVAIAQRRGVNAAVNFREAECVLAARVNRALGRDWACVEAHEVARDKSRQRAFLVAAGIPAPRHEAVTTPGEASAAAASIGYPVVIKPSRATASSHVVLVEDEPELLAALERIALLASTATNHLYEQGAGPLALVEEFLPGDEVTVDALVLDGHIAFHAVHAKERMPGPYFLEDFYVLPGVPVAEERTLVPLVQQIVDGLGLRLALVNVELRRDARGHWRIVEFATRITGGHAYRNIREVYGIDLVRLYGAACLGLPELPVGADRAAPRMTTCIKRVSREGVVVCNAAGRVASSPHYLDYTALAAPGRHVRLPPAGFDAVGLLSVTDEPDETGSGGVIRELAVQLEQELDVVVN